MRTEIATHDALDPEHAVLLLRDDVDSMRQRLWKSAVSITRNAGDADDLCQETLFRLGEWITAPPDPAAHLMRVLGLGFWFPFSHQECAEYQRRVMFLLQLIGRGRFECWLRDYQARVYQHMLRSKYFGQAAEGSRHRARRTRQSRGPLVAIADARRRKSRVK